MRTARILLVEDSADDVDLTLRAFHRSRVPAEIFVVRDGAEALDYLFGTGAHSGHEGGLPELVLLDLNLPKLHGLEVLRRLRRNERTRRLPVVILTSSVEERDVGSSYDLGANSYFRKPVDSAQFEETARQLGRYWLELNQPPPASSVGA